MLAERAAGERERRPVGTADQLDHDIDAVAPGKQCHVVFPGVARQIEAAVLGAIASADGGDLEPTSGAAGNQFAVRLDQANHAATDRAETGKSDS